MLELFGGAAVVDHVVGGRAALRIGPQPRLALRQPFEAAELDGVPASFVFFRITLPMLTPYILTAGIFRMLDSMQQFDIIYSMTQGGPGNALTVFQVQAYLEAFSFSNIGKSAALVLVLWAITYALSTLFIKHWLKIGRAHV